MGFLSERMEGSIEGIMCRIRRKGLEVCITLMAESIMENGKKENNMEEGEWC